MTRYILTRLVHAVAVVLAATFVVFLVLQVLGDPVRLMLPLGASDENIARVRAMHGFDDPIITQYLRFLGHAISGNFGDSLVNQQPAMSVALQALPKTLAIMLPAWAIGVTLGSVAGHMAAVREGSVMDSCVSALSYLSISIAEFWVALVLIYIAAVHLGIAAVGGYALDFQHLLLPIAVLSIVPFAQTAQVMRASAIEEYRMPYVLAARARGVPGRMIALRHVLPNASIPVGTIAIYSLSMLTSTAAVETVFSWPGLGRLTVDSLSRGDIFVVEAIIVLSAVTTVLLNVVADILTFRFDPRTRSLVTDGSR
jgi:peptide/nickel transport system permease protein